LNVPAAVSMGEADLSVLAAFGADSAIMERLQTAQLAKHLILVEAVRRRSGEEAQASFRTLAALQQDAPKQMAELLTLPQVGCWAVDSLQRLNEGRGLDLRYLNAFATGAAFHTGRPWTRAEESGTLQLPGLGTLTAHQWTPIPRIQAAAGGLKLSVRLDATDPYLTGFGPRGDADLHWWGTELKATWDILTQRHRRTAEALAKGFTTLVPLLMSDVGISMSATSGWAYGAIALSPPTDLLSFAESLVHESQHMVLGAVEDLVRLTEPDDGRRWYAPWRSDPRPLSALLQGCYASLGMAGFWRAEYRRGPARSRARAEIEFAYRRAITWETICRLASSGGLTHFGGIFVAAMRDRLRPWLDEPVSSPAEQQATRRRSEHRVRWQQLNPGHAL
jgi:hypothetical protein